MTRAWAPLVGWGALHDTSPLVASGQSPWGARGPAALLLALVSEGAPPLGLGFLA